MSYKSYQMAFINYFSSAHCEVLNYSMCFCLSQCLFVWSLIVYSLNLGNPFFFLPTGLWGSVVDEKTLLVFGTHIFFFCDLAVNCNSAIIWYFTVSMPVFFCEAISSSFAFCFPFVLLLPGLRTSAARCVAAPCSQRCWLSPPTALPARRTAKPSSSHSRSASRYSSLLYTPHHPEQCHHFLGSDLGHGIGKTWCKMAF